MTHYITLCNTLYLAIAHIFRPQNQELLMEFEDYISDGPAEEP